MRSIVLLAMLSGCGLYFGGGGGGGDGGVCNDPVHIETPASSMRDPYTGQCEQIGGYSCDCEPCPASGELLPNWSSCASSCLGRDVTNCEATGYCQAEYLDTSYWGCFPVEPNVVIDLTTACSTLSSDVCTGRDDCIAVYTSANDGTLNDTKFLRCDPEVTSPPPPPPPACDTLTTETDCVARGDCDAVYTGYDCTCDASGCVCKTEVFASCQTR
jgi:hypothetical protein